MNSNEVVARYVPEVRTLIGSDLELTAALRRQHQLGRLLTPVSEIRPVRIGDQWSTTVRLARPMTEQEMAAATPSWWGLHGREVGIAAGVFAVLGLLSAVVTVVISLVTTVADNGSYLLFGAIVLGVLWVWLSAKKGHPCTGLHCPGCRGRH
jgi:hypothetical protein